MEISVEVHRCKIFAFLVESRRSLQCDAMPDAHKLVFFRKDFK